MILKLREEQHRWAMAIKGARELFMTWRDCGLLDERGQARPPSNHAELEIDRYLPGAYQGSIS